MTHDTNWLISVDDHVIEPPNVWQDRVPSKYRDAAPRVETDPRGDAWIYDGKRTSISGLEVVVGKPKEEWSPAPARFADMRPGCYDPRARVQDMDQAGILASALFPSSFVRFCGQAFSQAEDRELALLCVRAYNDWMIDEWCAAAPGRYIPIIILPLWDPRLAAGEIERCASKGAKGIAFSENPYPLGLPSLHDPDRYWDPVFSAANETGLPLCTHIGSSSRLPSTAPDMPLIESIVFTPLNSMYALGDWLFSGHLTRFPKLKIILSEGGIGWLPYLLYRADVTVERQGGWASKADFSVLGAGTRQASVERSFDVPPSVLFREHLFGCFIEDPPGVAALEMIGIDNVMVEVDYPHSDSSWPNSIGVSTKALQGLPDSDTYKVLQGNARRVFKFEPAPAPSV